MYFFFFLSHYVHSRAQADLFEGLPKSFGPYLHMYITHTEQVLHTCKYITSLLVLLISLEYSPTPSKHFIKNPSARRYGKEGVSR